MKPVVIIAAPRSGTNVLRDVLCRLPGLVTWPCDEINTIWRHGNARHPHDELAPELATSGVRRYIRARFADVARRRGGSVVVEKTCANSLRVDFVDRVLPDATYVFLVRDAVDAVASAMKRWRAPLEIGYTLRKARYVPLTDIPYYAGRFLWNRRIGARGPGHLAWWGPVFDGMRDLAGRVALEELCALQWKACNERAEQSFGRMTPGRVLRVVYEEFARDPREVTSRICEFIGRPVPSDVVDACVAAVRPDSIGRGREELDDAELGRIQRSLETA